jgi:hypothetical protein
MKQSGHGLENLATNVPCRSPSFDIFQHGEAIYLWIPPIDMGFLEPNPSKFTLNALTHHQTVENSCLEKVNNVIAKL